MRITKSKIAAVAAATAVIALTGTGAMAYFSQTGTGSGPATVGSVNKWTVAVQAQTLGVANLFPDGSTQTFPFTVTNSSAGGVKLFTTSAAIDANGSGDILSGGTAVTGCKASWFSAAIGTNPAPSAGNIAAAGVVNGTAVITMLSNTTDDQNVCQGKSPSFTVTAN